MKNFIKLLFFIFYVFSTYNLFAVEKTSTAVFTGEEYSIYVTYLDSVNQGDAICVKMDIIPSRKTMKEPFAETQGILIFDNNRKSEFFIMEETKNSRQNSNTAISMCALIPISTWQESGNYNLSVMYSAYGKDYMKFSLPIKITSKDFISKTIELNAANTSIKTDNSPTRMKQIDKLNKILSTKNFESVYQKKIFTPPTDATRRTSFFGDRRVYSYITGESSTSLHHGIDYGIPTGTPVYACGNGVVVLAEERVSTGWSVVIEHLPGLYSLYYHLDSYSVKEGQYIEQGQQLGVSGATGLATGPHLHWEMRLNGESVSPDFFTNELGLLFQ